MATSRITDPAASYIAAGNLLCTLCRVPVKSSALWSSHTQTERHTKLLQTSSTNIRRRKRSPEADDQDGPSDRKRVRSDQHEPDSRTSSINESTIPKSSSSSNEPRLRATNGRLASRPKPTEDQVAWKQAVQQAQRNSALPADFFANSALTAEDRARAQMPPPPRPPEKKAKLFNTTPPPPPVPMQADPAPSLDDEMLAFEQELATIPDEPAQVALDPLEALSAPLRDARPAALAAAPQYASEFLPTNGEEGANPPASIEESNLRRADLQKQEDEEENEERERRLREEFEEMRELEERVRVMKEKRETLRRGTSVAVEPGGVDRADVLGEQQALRGKAEGKTSEQPGVDKVESSDEDDGNGDDYEGWGFR